MCVFDDPVVSDSMWPHGLQLARLPHPLLSPRVCSNSSLLSWWCHPTISSFVELHLMQPNSEKTIWSLSKLCFLLPSSCYNYSVFGQMANNFWSQTRCSRSSANLQADNGSETNLKAVTVAQHCFHEEWPQKKKKKKGKKKWIFPGDEAEIKADKRREGFPNGSAIKNLPAMRETQVWYMGQEESVEEEIATHSSIFAWRIP